MSRFLAALLFAGSSILIASATAQAEELVVYNWNDYIAPQVLADFEKDTGIHIDYHTYSTAEDLEKALNSGESIDVAVPSHDTLPGLIKAGRLQPLDLTRLPNRTHLDKQLLSKLNAVDPQNRYAIPYLWGAVGLAINVPQAEKAFGGPLPNSWSLLFDPAQSAKLATCGISVLDAPDEVMSVAMNYMGRSLAHSPSTQIKQGGSMLEAVRHNVRYVDSERYIDDLKTGKLCMSLAWVGDALGASAAGQNVHFVVPDEGSVLFIDNLVIPSSARRADLAHRFIDYLMQPKVAAQITTETLYPSGNADAREFLDPTLRDQPGLYPDKATKRRLAALEVLPEKTAAVKDQVWGKFRDGS